MARLSRFSRILRRSSRRKLALFLSLISTTLLALGILFISYDSNANRRSTISDDEIGRRGGIWMETLSWEPRAFLYHNFLSKEESKHLIELAKPHMRQSLVVDSSTGRGKGSRVRTSTGMFLERGQDSMALAIEKSIADFTYIPTEYGEGLQILHYQIGQKYEPHPDYFVDVVYTKFGSQRLATLLMYISDVEEGGETIFPDAKINVTSLPWYNDLSECGKKGLSIKPRMGDALLFWSMKPDSTLDRSSIHGGCPVNKGNKWVATKWMHAREFEKLFATWKYYQEHIYVFV